MTVGLGSGFYKLCPAFAVPAKIKLWTTHIVQLSMPRLCCNTTALVYPRLEKQRSSLIVALTGSNEEIMLTSKILWKGPDWNRMSNM